MGDIKLAFINKATISAVSHGQVQSQNDLIILIGEHHSCSPENVDFGYDVVS